MTSQVIALPEVTDKPTFLQRWFTPEEIVAILLSALKHKDWIDSSHVFRPRSGSVVLLCKGIEKNDGYSWTKRRDKSQLVREDHVKLKVNGVELIAANYRHSSLLSTFHRRAYYLLSNPNVLLLHYLNVPNLTTSGDEPISKLLTFIEHNNDHSQEMIIRELIPILNCVSQPKQMHLRNFVNECFSGVFADSTTELIPISLIDMLNKLLSSVSLDDFIPALDSSKTAKSNAFRTYSFNRSSGTDVDVVVVEPRSHSISESNHNDKTTTRLMVISPNPNEQQQPVDFFVNPSVRQLQSIVPRSHSISESNHNDKTTTRLVVLSPNSTKQQQPVDFFVNPSIRHEATNQLINSNQTTNSSRLKRHVSDLQTASGSVRSRRKQLHAQQSVYSDTTSDDVFMNNTASRRMITEPQDGVSINTTGSSKDSAYSSFEFLQQSCVSDQQQQQLCDNIDTEQMTTNTGNPSTIGLIATSQSQLSAYSSADTRINLGLTNEEINRTLSANMEPNDLSDIVVTSCAVGSNHDGDDNNTGAAMIEDDELLQFFHGFSKSSADSTFFSNATSVPNRAVQITNTSDYGDSILSVDIPNKYQSSNISPYSVESDTSKLTITEYCPDWSYTEGGIKVLISGPWSYSQSKQYLCLFDHNLTIPAQLVQDGVLRCTCPAHPVGTVDLQVIRDDGTVLSDSVPFHYRTTPVKSDSAMSVLINDDFTTFSGSLLSRLEYLESRLGMPENGAFTAAAAAAQAPSSLTQSNNCLQKRLVNIVVKLNQMNCLYCKNNITINDDDNSVGLLHFAAALGFLELIKQLLLWRQSSCQHLTFDLDALCVDINGRTPLMYACMQNHTDCAKYLVGCARDALYICDNDNCLPLVKSFHLGYFELVKEVVEYFMYSEMQPASHQAMSCSKHISPMEAQRLHTALWVLTSGQIDSGRLFCSDLDTDTTTACLFCQNDDDQQQLICLAQQILNAIPDRIKQFDDDNLDQNSESFSTNTDWSEFFRCSNIISGLHCLTLNDQEQRELYFAARVIQQAFRQYKVRIRSKKQQDIEKRAAVLIQTYYRRYKQYCYFKRLHGAALMIQRHFRHYRAAKQVSHFTPQQQQQQQQQKCNHKQVSIDESLINWKQHLAAIRIQHAYRGHFMRKRQDAARKIQRFMRESRKKLRLQHQKQLLVSLQNDAKFVGHYNSTTNLNNQLLQ